MFGALSRSLYRSASIPLSSVRANMILQLNGRNVEVLNQQKTGSGRAVAGCTVDYYDLLTFKKGQLNATSSTKVTKVEVEKIKLTVMYNSGDSMVLADSNYEEIIVPNSLFRSGVSSLNPGDRVQAYLDSSGEVIKVTVPGVQS